MKKILALVLAFVLVIGATVAGTVAYLQDKTDAVVNTFTIGKIKISLTETWNTDSNNDETLDSWTGMFVPGEPLTKDPKVTVEKNSEDCWLFVKVTEEKWPTWAHYVVDDTVWTQLKDGEGKEVPGVFYKVVDKDTAKDQPFYILKASKKDNAGNPIEQIQVNNTITEESGDITLTFQAFAVQKDSFNNALEAWNAINPYPID